MPCVVLAALLAAGVTDAVAQAGRGGTPRAGRGGSSVIQAGVLDLSSVRRLFQSVARRRESMSAGELVGAWTDVSILLAAVTGTASGQAPTFEEVVDASLKGKALNVPATRGVASRDAAAERLLALGYSAREVADVLTQRISQRALDRARQMIAVGVDRQAAADYLDREYTQVRAMFTTPRPTPGEVLRGVPGAFDAFIERYAALHQVESAIVRAIIATESDFNPLARSKAGAIGLMQLMPGTARELGVNPLIPEQNIEGGVRYFAQLLKTFGKVELALVAYNAGPGFAERYARGQTGLYGETREYVARVLTRLKNPPRGPVRGDSKPGRLVGHS